MTTASKGDRLQYEVYRSANVAAAWARDDSMLETEEDCRLAMILIGLLSGGDYAPDGVARIGPTMAMGLAHAGCATFLKAYGTPSFDGDMGETLDRMVEELRGDVSGFIGRRNPVCAGRLEVQTPEQVFPSFPLSSYLNPVVSPEDSGWPGFGRGASSSARGRSPYGGRWQLDEVARACEQYFEWATVEGTVKKFCAKDGFFCGEIIHEARKRILAEDARRPGRASAPPAAAAVRSGLITSHFANATVRKPAKPPRPAGGSATDIPSHLVKIHGTREAPHTDGMVEYRLSFKPDVYVDIVRDSMEGSRVDPATMSPRSRSRLGLVDIDSHDAAPTDAPVPKEIKLWIPEYLIRGAWPELVEAYEAIEEAKAAAAFNKAQAAADRAFQKAAKAVEKGLDKPLRGRKQKATATATSENPNAFRAFFTQNAEGSTSLHVAAGVSKEGSASAPPRRGRAVQESPVSSLTTLLEQMSQSSVSQSPIKSRHQTSGKPTRRAKSPVPGASKFTGMQDDPIDLCDSDSEPERQPRRRVGRPRSRTPPPVLQESLADNVARVASPKRSPGRPRKTPSLEHLSLRAPSRRSPGWPRKSPPMESLSLPEHAVTPPPSRSPGRPRKSPSVEPLCAASASFTLTPPPPRGPGRPRKSPSTVDSIEDSLGSLTLISPPKRSTSARLQSVPETSPEVVTRRRPGRPRMQSSPPSVPAVREPLFLPSSPSTPPKSASRLLDLGTPTPVSNGPSSPKRSPGRPRLSTATPEPEESPGAAASVEARRSPGRPRKTPPRPASPSPVRRRKATATPEPEPEPEQWTETIESLELHRGPGPSRKTPPPSLFSPAAEIFGTTEAEATEAARTPGRPRRATPPAVSPALDAVQAVEARRSAGRPPKTPPRRSLTPPVAKRSVGRPKKVTATTTSPPPATTQTFLDSLIVARPLRKTKAEKAAASKPRKPKYTVTVDDEGIEHVHIHSKH